MKKILMWVLITLLFTLLIQCGIGFIHTIPFQPTFIGVAILRLLGGK